ncbi:MAG: BON domain-containing protein [Sulfuriferula sp.]
MKYLVDTPTKSVVSTAFLGIFMAMAPIIMTTLHAADTGRDTTFAWYDRHQSDVASKVEAATTRQMSSGAFDEADSNHAAKLGKDEFVRAQSLSDRRKMAKYVDDSVITAKVETRLIKHSLFKGLQIHVQTYKGAVLLSGFVDSARQAVTAGRIAAGIEGVTKVINSLVPKNAE